MKKKIWIPIVVSVVLLAILFVPIPMGSYDDGGTREYIALTYKIVDWNKLSADGVYEKTCIYFGKDRLKSINQLWLDESETIEHEFRAVVKEINGEWIKVEPVKGEVECNYSLEIEFHSGNLPETIILKISGDDNERRETFTVFC